MRRGSRAGLILMALFLLMSSALATAKPVNGAPARPQGPCDIYTAAGDPCVAAYSTTRAMYSSYNGPLYQVMRQSDGKTLDIGVVQPAASPVPNAGGYADAAAQDAFCANTYCWITILYDQSPKHNNLTQAPRGNFSGPAMGGLNNLPIADMAPVTVMGHKVYGVFIEPGMGLRNDSPTGTAVDDQAEGEYWVVNGRHYNSGCCFDFGNAEIDSHDDGNGTMETAYFGSAGVWYSGKGKGPWIMTDQENNLVGCVRPDRSKGCPNLPSIPWRFVTAIAEGEPHHWTSMGGNAQEGRLRVMFSGPRVNATYDPMRKQGAILLGNGGDNSNHSQGTFYEGAMTAAGTFPSEATEQRVQANIVSAGYDVPALAIAPASKIPSRLQTFSPGSSRETTVTFTNVNRSPVEDVALGLTLPNKHWGSFMEGATGTTKTVAGPVAPGASVSATFKVTSGPAPFNGDLVGNVSWKNPVSHRTRSETAALKVRNVSPVRVNQFRISSGPPVNRTNSFVELLNAGSKGVDISNWTLTIRPTGQASFSTVTIPAGTKLAAGGSYLLGLSNSGLAVPAHAGDSTIYVRSTAGMSAGAKIEIGAGPDRESRRITAIGTAASVPTTLWQPLPDGPIITIPAGATNVPVESTAGFVVGQKIALGYGATYPVAARTPEQYEVATVTAVGKPGTQACLATDAPAGATNIKVTSVAGISVGDKIRLDIDSLGHGIETVTVLHVGNRAIRTSLSADANAGASEIKVRSAGGLSVGDKLIVGTPANWQTVKITGIEASNSGGRHITIAPALNSAHIQGEDVVMPGTGLDLAAPLKFSHAANLPFSDRGTGISFRPATAFAQSSDEPVQALGAGITLGSPLSHDHAIHAVVRDAEIKTAGYQGQTAPEQWFGGPALSNRAGSMALRNAVGMVVDSLNYGVNGSRIVDPVLAEGYQGASGSGKGGCYVHIARAPGNSPAGAPHNQTWVVGAARVPSGYDTDSNCTDFRAMSTSAIPSTSSSSKARTH